MKDKEINFLPKDLQPKQKPKKEPKKEIEWVNLEKNKKINNSPRLTKLDRGEKSKGGQLGSFKIFSKKDNLSAPAKQLQPSKQEKTIKKSLVKEAREDLLKEIGVKSDPVKITKNQPVKIKQPKIKKPSLLVRFLAKRKVKKAAKQEKKLQQKLKAMEGKRDKQKFKKISHAKPQPKAVKLNKKVKKSFFTRLSERRIKKKEDKTKKQQEKKMQHKLKQVKKDTKKIVKGKESKSVFSGKYNTVKEAKDRDILETNLMRGKVLKIFSWQKAIIVNIIFILISAGILGGVYIYLNWQNSIGSQLFSGSELSNTKKEFNKLKQEIDSLDTLRVQTIELSKLLDKHVYWTNFFSYLESSTLEGIYYKNFSGNLEGDYKLDAIANDFPTFVSQIGFLQKDKEYIRSVDIKGSQLVTERYKVDAITDGSGKSRSQTKSRQVVSFDIDLEIDPKIFYK